ncbi:MAG: hypothetical protein CVV33_05470 [Methanomicrobiales archaeon HGW-Methanomicrobiales-4]|nr:MAG: hypothetical protein CVV33_05470 [Methanomicrobiales archaeon HGW-Methanomicrobiales-4]
MDRMGHIARGFFLLVIIGALMSSQASAQPIKAPYVITSPGMYELSEDVRGLTDTYGIKIESSNVVLDGGGHFLGGDNGEKSVGVYANLYGGSITNVTVKNFLLEDWETGVGYNYVKGQEGDTNLISKCNVVKSGTAIHVQYSDYVTVDDNSISDCSTGIIVDEHSTFSRTGNNEIKNVGLGMSVSTSTQVSIEENNINTCEVYGLEVVDSDTISVTKNGISDNNYAAFRVENSKKLNITGNNFSKTTTGGVVVIGNNVHDAVITNNWFGSYEDVSVDDVSSGIIWNSTLIPGTNILGGPYLGGNYWGAAPGEKGFSDTAPDEDGFGISDKPYQINDMNVDYLPLTHTTATKAPEEQVDNLTEEVVAEQDQGINLTNQTVPTEALVASDTSSSPVPVIPEQNDTSQSIPVNTILNQTNATHPVQILPETNGSIMNRSMTNAVSSASSDFHEAESGKTLDTELAGSDQMIPVVEINPNMSVILADNLTKGSEMTGRENITSPALVGYLVFTSSESDPRIILITTRGTEVSLDPVDGHNLTVPVPVEEMVYTRFRVEKDGFTPVSGNITPYPGAGQTTTIPVVLIRNVNSTITEQTNQSGQVSSTPVISNNSQPIVVTNGVTLEKSTKSHLISATAGPGGAIFPQGSVQIQDGGSIAFIIDPNDGKRIAYLVIDGVQTSPMSEYRFINVTSDHVIVGGFT